MQSELHVLHNRIFLRYASALCFAKKPIIPLSGVGVWDETTLNDGASEGGKATLQFKSISLQVLKTMKLNREESSDDFETEAALYL